MRAADDRRLVWADELLERGDPRGELIVTQCALARGDLPRDESLRRRRREAELLEQIPGSLDLADACTWIRGAIEEITIPLARFLEHKGALFEQAPFLHRLRIPDLPRELDAAIANLEAIFEEPRIDGVAIHLGGEEAFAHRLVETMPWPARLRSFAIFGVSLHRIAQNPLLSHLDELDVMRAAEPLAGGPIETSLRPRKLRVQSFSQQRDVMALESLAGPELLSRVEELDLDWFLRATAGVTSDPAVARRLRRLRMPTGISARPLSYSVLTEGFSFESLEELDISFFGLEEETDFGPLSSGAFPKLRVLRIGPGLSTSEKIRELLRSPLADTLEVLDVSRNRWRVDAGVDWDGIVLT